MTDIKTLLAEIEAGLKHLPLGAWEIDSERQTDSPYRHLEYALFDTDRNRLCGTENSDGGWLEVEYPTGPDDDGEIWNTQSKGVIEHIARLCPVNTRDILDHIKALEAENAKLREFVSSLVHMQSGDGWTRAIVREAAADLLRDIGAPIMPMADTTPAFVARVALGGDNG